MATELTLLLRFEDWAPAAEDIEYALDCTVLEYDESEEV